MVCQMCQISILDINKPESKAEDGLFCLCVTVLCPCCAAGALLEVRGGGGESMQSGDSVRFLHCSCHGVAVFSFKDVTKVSVFPVSHEKCFHCSISKTKTKKITCG